MAEKETTSRSSPRFSMDLMIFGNINEINKFIDTNAVEVEGGNMNSFHGWKAGLFQLYRNIESFIDDDAKKRYFDNAFKMLDRMINPYNQTLPSNLRELQITLTLMRDLTSALYEERNNTFIKIRKTFGTIDKIIEQDFGILGKQQRDIIRKKLEADDGIQNEKP